ncbi:MAG: hypothetical protein KJO85_11135, partial [Gammaproteobacteria bacterium]|nr:hypothetical protein [Gammaproteobacteria bacterium]
MKKSAPWLFLILLVAAFAAWYLLQRPAPESHPSIVALPEVREPATPPKAEFPLVVNESPGDTPPEPLPPLAQSDEAVSEALAAIAGAERLGSLLVLEQIINRLVATV